jgi:outer membrane protein OmpA-like peptidoglycan-associated protein
VKQPGFMPFQAEFLMQPNQDFQYTIELIPIKVGAKAILRNIYFAPNSASLTIDALEGLEKLVEFMKLNPKVEILISGHTDIGSTQDYNIKLSEARAKAVKDYLVQMGINPLRIGHKGYGNSRPIADNNNAEGRSLNRRIEIEIIKM